MIPGMVYNVTQGTWHNVMGTRDATWLIVEARNTSIGNSDYMFLNEEEKRVLLEQCPSWLKENLDN
jgi:hypothetical protein